MICQIYRFCRPRGCAMGCERKTHPPAKSLAQTPPDRPPMSKKPGAIKKTVGKIFCVPGQLEDTGGDQLPLSVPVAARKPLTAACAECGAPFEQTPPNGRPLRFCSPACRSASKNQQMKAWRQKASKPNPQRLTCRQCGEVFPAPRRAAGRVPHWCSPACKRAFFSASAAPNDNQSTFNFT